MAAWFDPFAFFKAAPKISAAYDKAGTNLVPKGKNGQPLYPTMPAGTTKALTPDWFPSWAQIKYTQPKTKKENVVTSGKNGAPPNPGLVDPAGGLPPEPPDQSDVNIQRAGAIARARATAKLGYSSTFLTGSRGLGDPATLIRRRLLGQ